MGLIKWQDKINHIEKEKDITKMQTGNFILEIGLKGKCQAMANFIGIKEIYIIKGISLTVNFMAVESNTMEIPELLERLKKRINRIKILFICKEIIG